MKLRLATKASLLILTCLLPTLGLCFYMQMAFLSCKGSYENLLKKFIQKERESSLNTPYTRQGIRKQIWFRPLENATALYFQAERSELFVKESGKQIKTQEKLYNVYGGFQDKPAPLEKFLTFPWLLRVIKADEALFDYNEQVLETKDVGIEIYQLKNPLNISTLQLPPTSLATVFGKADKIRINCKTRPPQFKAKHFKAQINPNLHDE